MISEDSIHHPYYGGGIPQQWEYKAAKGNKLFNNRVIAVADGSGSISRRSTMVF